MTGKKTVPDGLDRPSHKLFEIRIHTATVTTPSSPTHGVGSSGSAQATSYPEPLRIVRIHPDIPDKPRPARLRLPLFCFNRLGGFRGLCLSGSFFPNSLPIPPEKPARGRNQPRLPAADTHSQPHVRPLPRKPPRPRDPLRKPVGRPGTGGSATDGGEATSSVRPQAASKRGILRKQTYRFTVRLLSQIRIRVLRGAHAFLHSILLHFRCIAQISL